MTKKERDVIAAAIRWNETRGDGDNYVELSTAVERLVHAGDPKRWAEVLAKYEAPTKEKT